MRFTKRWLSVIVLICFSGYDVSLANEITIRFIGNCALYLTDGNIHIYVDFPYKSGAHHYMKYDKAEIENIKERPVFIFTHRHSDHYSKKLLKKREGKVYGPWNKEKLAQLNHSIPEFNIQAFKTKHRFSFNHCSYLITWHGKKIFISGDTENAEILVARKGMDWVFIPAWLLIDANKKNIKIDTKKIGLYHIGPNDKITTQDPKIQLLDKQGDVISVLY